MTARDLEKFAIEEVMVGNPGGIEHQVKNIYDNVMDGLLIEVQFTTKDGVRAINHVYRGEKKIGIYRSFHEVCAAVANHKEPSFFFRLLNFTGVGGLIALTLVVVFSVLLSVLALTNVASTQNIIEVIKFSFAIILGYFFGSQRSRNE